MKSIVVTLDGCAVWLIFMIQLIASTCCSEPTGVTLFLALNHIRKMTVTLPIDADKVFIVCLLSQCTFPLPDLTTPIKLYQFKTIEICA